MKQRSSQEILSEESITVYEKKDKREKALQYSKLLEGVLEGIPDIIGVYKPDNTIMFYNQAGYEFYNKTFEEVKGKKCFEMLGRNKKCANCTVEQAVKSNKRIRREKYIPKFKKFIDCCCNPVFNDSGEVMFIVEQLRDITERKNLENILKESEERYRQIVDLSPDAIIITIDGKIVLANKEALKYYDNVLGERVHQYAPDFAKTIDKRIKQILKHKITKAIFDYKVPLSQNKIVDMEVSSSYLMYKGKPAVLSIIRDITERKKGLNSAAKIQRQILKKTFPIRERAKIETLYVPAKTVSGDFFSFHKVNEELVIGIIGDVSGKGVTAALNISAFNVLFHEAVLANHEPLEIIHNLNRKIDSYLGETYIAACCFSIDFKNNQAKVVGAGINEFIYKDNENRYSKKIVKGPFLGMFENSIFDQEIIDFQLGDRLYFFSDGIELMFDEEIIEEYMKKCTITEFKNYLNDSLSKMLTEIYGIKDDCTMLALEIQ